MHSEAFPGMQWGRNQRYCSGKLGLKSSGAHSVSKTIIKGCWKNTLKPRNMKNKWTAAVYHSGNVSMNLFLAKKGAVQFCSIKIPVSLPSSARLHFLFFFTFMDISSSKGLSLMCRSLSAEGAELEIWQRFTVLRLWLTRVTFTVWPWGDM